MIEKRIKERRKLTIAAHIRMLLFQGLAAIGLVLVGTILALTFISDQGLWETVKHFWGIK